MTGDEDVMAGDENGMTVDGNALDCGISDEK